MKLEFDNLAFSEKEDKIRVVFLKIYYFYLDKKKIGEIGDFNIGRDYIEFKSSKKDANVENKFNYLLNEGFAHLKTTLNNKPAIYVHKHSGIPLIGSNEFGIIDRGTNTIEVKPLTTCNIDCIFCSVDHTKRTSDIVVEADYLIEELKKVIRIKKNPVNIHIGSQGDPSLYGDLIRLVKEIRAIKQVNAISMVTNGIIINKKMAQDLIDSGMTHFHISLHSTNEKKADMLANAPYPVKKVMSLCRFIVKKARLLIVPVYLPGLNDEDIEDVIKFAKEINAELGIQNFLEYKFGKKPVKGISMDKFFSKVKEWESKFEIDLTNLDTDLEFKEDTKIEKPFKKGDVISVEIKAKSRLKHSVISVSKDRVVTVINCDKNSGSIKVKIIRDKHNIFTAVHV